MAVINTHFLALAMVVVAMATLMLADLGITEMACSGEMDALRKQCAKYVEKDGKDQFPPSPECRTQAKKFDFYTRKGEEVRVARYCGLKVQFGLKCGSYTTPPNLMI
ncbi:hypothetical protein Pint_30940 [Pistacia integerrima]|uniref:Uncharacterized protein n=2 Tax=Pistacia TaxID=55512 RepID=A0ACC1A772_9ROSI|nr:hypothetical protein Pint_30940 [Pistacia integerrima]KAJ0083345.1 hypothetical protein Patl1_29464 [Pistacia atlantica]